MATESSAVVRFISLAQQAQNPVRSTQEAPITSEFGTEVLREVRHRPKSSRAPLVVGALALAGAAAVGGVYLGKNGLGGSSEEKPSPAAATPAAGAVGNSETPATAAASPNPVPQVAAPVVTVPTDVLAATGFDIRVEPAANVTLDGSLLGKAPLRVRNLQPGMHVVDIDAPAGYFSRRVELSLDPGEAEEINLSLDPVDDRVAAAEPESKPARRSRAELRRERKEKARAEKERKKELRAARLAAAKAAKSAKPDKKSAVTAEPLPEAKAEAKPQADAKMSAADAELEAAMADIVGKPKRKNPTAAAASLAPAADSASESGHGTLMLGSKPPCDILVDGKATGLKTPQRAMDLPAGTHRITLVNKELGVEKKFKVKIAAGKTTKAIQDLTSNLD